MTPSQRIDQLIASIPDWRGKTFAVVRKAILSADKAITEDWKWMGSPVWYRDGMIAVANAHKGKVKVKVKVKVKLTFLNGAHVPDPGKLFNDGLDGNQRRAIDFFEGDRVDGPALTRLVRAAIAFNQDKVKKKAPVNRKVKKPAPLKRKVK